MLFTVAVVVWWWWFRCFLVKVFDCNFQLVVVCRHLFYGLGYLSAVVSICISTQYVCAYVYVNMYAFVYGLYNMHNSSLTFTAQGKVCWWQTIWYETTWKTSFLLIRFDLRIRRFWSDYLVFQCTISGKSKRGELVKWRERDREGMREQPQN